MNLLDLLIDAYSVVVILAVVLSWLRQGSGNPFARFVYSLTEPALEPIRRMLIGSAMRVARLEPRSALGSR